jgi:hypothetical protein
MPLSLCFWILILFWLIFGLFTAWPGSSVYIGGYGFFGHTLLLFILLVLLGWKVFGAPLHGG